MAPIFAEPKRLGAALLWNSLEELTTVNAASPLFFNGFELEPELLVPLRRSPMQRPASCSECDRLWRDYARAAAEFLDLMKDEIRAIAGQDVRGADGFQRRLDFAGWYRTEARKRIAEHQWVAHSEEALGLQPREARTSVQLR